MVTCGAHPDMRGWIRQQTEDPLARSPKSDAAFRTVYDRCFPAIRSYCLRRLPPGEVNDAIAEVFLVAWRRIGDAPPSDEAQLWLYGIARNVIRNSRRADRRQLRLRVKAQGVRTTSEPDPETIVVRRSEDDEVLHALDALRPMDREVLRLSIWEELTNAEIAGVLNLDPHAVTMRLTRARKRMARQLGIDELPTGTRIDPQPSGQGGEQ